MRGMAVNNRSTRCIRVLEMASRMSATQVDSRSKALSSSGSVDRSRSLRDSSFRASTMSDTPFINWSISDSGKRIVRGADCPAEVRMTIGADISSSVTVGSVSASLPVRAAIR